MLCNTYDITFRREEKSKSYFGSPAIHALVAFFIAFKRPAVAEMEIAPSAAFVSTASLWIEQGGEIRKRVLVMRQRLDRSVREALVGMEDVPEHMHQSLRKTFWDLPVADAFQLLSSAELLAGRIGSTWNDLIGKAFSKEEMEKKKQQVDSEKKSRRDALVGLAGCGSAIARFPRTPTPTRRRHHHHHP